MTPFSHMSKNTVIFSQQPFSNEFDSGSNDKEISVHIDLEMHSKQNLNILRHRASTKIQRVWRANQVRKCLKPMKNESHSLIIVDRQHYGRDSRIIVEMKYVITIQSFWRSKKARNNFIKIKYSIINVQNWSRSVILARIYKRKLNCVKKIQTCARKYIITRKVRAAITIQNLYRDYRACMQRKQYKMKQKVKSATMIQSRFRLYITKKKILRLQKSELLMKEIDVDKKSSLTQPDANEKTAKRSLIYNSSDNIVEPLHKKVKRAQCCKNSKKSLETNILIIQCAWRRYKSKLFCDKQKEFISIQFQSACIIQSLARKWMAQNRKTDIYNCSIVCQRIWRGYKARLRFRRLKAMQRRQILSVCKIQSAVRRWSDRIKLRLNNDSAVIIQKIWLGYKAKLEFKSTVESIILIQRCYRCRKKVKDFLKMKQSSIVIQSIFRGHIVRKDATIKQIAKEEAKILIQAESAAVKQVRALSDDLTFPLFKGIDHPTLDISDFEALAGESSTSSRQLSLVVMPTNNAIFHAHEARPLPQYIRIKHQSIHTMRDEVDEASSSTLNTNERLKNPSLEDSNKSSLSEVINKTLEMNDNNQVYTVVKNQNSPSIHAQEDNKPADNEKKANFDVYLKEIIDTNSCTDSCAQNASSGNNNTSTEENSEFDWINNW